MCHTGNLGSCRAPSELWRVSLRQTRQVGLRPGPGLERGRGRGVSGPVLVSETNLDVEGALQFDRSRNFPLLVSSSGHPLDKEKSLCLFNDNKKSCKPRR